MVVPFTVNLHWAVLNDDNFDTIDLAEGTNFAFSSPSRASNFPAVLFQCHIPHQCEVPGMFFDVLGSRLSLSQIPLRLWVISEDAQFNKPIIYR